MKNLKIIFRFIVVLGVLGLVFGCGGGGGSSDDGTSSSGSSTEVTYNYVGTQTAGDFWQLASDDDSDTGDFTITNETTGYSYSGTAAPSEEAGFIKLDVTDSDNPDFEGPVTAYMVKVPGTMIMATPGPFELFDHGSGENLFGSADPPIMAIKKGDCPAAGGTFNMIMMPPEDWDSTDTPAYGRAEVTVNGDGTYDIAFTVYLLDGTEVFNGAISGATCEDGVITGDLDIEGNSVEAKLSFTESGLFFVDLPQGEGSFVGVASDTNVDADDFFAAGRTFTGMYLNSNYGYASGVSHPETDPVYSETDGTSTIKSYQYTADLEAGGGNRTDPFDMSLENMTQPFPGLIRTECTDADGTHDFVLALRKIAGRYFFFAVSDNWPSMHGYNVMMIEQ